MTSPPIRQIPIEHQPRQESTGATEAARLRLEAARIEQENLRMRLALAQHQAAQKQRQPPTPAYHTPAIDGSSQYAYPKQDQTSWQQAAYYQQPTLSMQQMLQRNADVSMFYQQPPTVAQQQVSRWTYSNVRSS